MVLSLHTLKAVGPSDLGLEVFFVFRGVGGMLSLEKGPEVWFSLAGLWVKGFLMLNIQLESIGLREFRVVGFEGFRGWRLYGLRFQGLRV